MDNRTSFVFDGRDSRDFYMYIENEVSFPSPEADVELVEVLGRDGDLAIWHDRYKGVDFSLPVIIRPPYHARIDEVATKISQWLKVDVGWKRLSLGSRSEYEFVALASSPFDIRRTIMNHGRTVLHFRLKPHKYRKGQQMTSIDPSTTLVNRENTYAEPLIQVTGNGDINLYNNGKRWLSLRDVQDEITVDSEMQSVYKGNRPAYNKMISDTGFPVLGQGNNKITWDGTVSKLELLPRWRSIM